MFSLIITIVSIALVTALVLATIYYGGSAFKQGATKAAADTLVLQGQQILAATDLYLINKGVAPANLEALVAAGYLSSVPAGYAAADISFAPFAYAAAKGWMTPADSRPTYRTSTAVVDAICKEVNLQTLGTNGILSQAYSQPASQCYRSRQDGVNYVVVTRAGDELASALPAADVAVATAGLPAFGDTSGGWSTAPTLTTASSSAGSGSSGGSAAGIGGAGAGTTGGAGSTGAGSGGSGSGPAVGTRLFTAACGGTTADYSQPLWYTTLEKLAAGCSHPVNDGFNGWIYASAASCQGAADYGYGCMRLHYSNAAPWQEDNFNSVIFKDVF